jgi:hypothetical protein
MGKKKRELVFGPAGGGTPPPLRRRSLPGAE